MIAVFSLVGLLLFGGGLYAIFDGWPYLVLERGFTEVIIGSIAATAGLIMLSLAWVLKELKAIRAGLTDAAEMRAPAAVPAEIVIPVAPPAMPPAGPAAVPSAAPATSAPGAPSSVVPVAMGVGAAAVAAVVAEKAGAFAPATGTAERDLFGKLVAAQAEAPGEPEDEQDEAPAPGRDETVPDMFEIDDADADGEPAEAEHPGAVATGGHAPAEAAVASFPPASEDEAPAHGDEPVEVEAEKDELEALPSGAAESAVEDRALMEEEAPRDEFAALRESLTSQLGGLHLPSGRIEPSLALEDDPFAEAEAWMAPDERREPHFAAPSPEVDAEPPVLAWPPRTEPQVPGGSAGHEGDPSGEDAGLAEREDDHAPHPADSVRESGWERPDQEETRAPEEHVAPPAQEQQVQELPAPEAPPQEPAASDEGVVGAYQVGETHFTIYADGSIRARTPDGEYSFASMDELKVYLASEKSRLGA